MTFASAKPRKTKYPADVAATAARLLNKSAVPRDALPYTEEFERLKSQYEAAHGTITNADFWRVLDDVGKHGGLAGRRGRKTAPRTPRLTSEEQLEVLRLFGGETGRRDHLPYTSRFDELHQRFVRQTGKQFTKHEFWRAVSRVAKLSRKPRPAFEQAPLGGLPVEVVQFIERMNPWWRGQAAPRTERFRRWAFHELERRLTAKVAPVVAIRGPRQVGKTTIQAQLIEELLLIRHVAPVRILRVQFDEVPGLGVLKHPVESIVRWYEDHVLRDGINAYAQRDQPVYLFFDEVQNLPKWSAQLKALVDHVSAYVVVTGSSALRIGRGRDSLAGRMTVIELGPLRLWEIAGIRGGPELKPFATGTDGWQKQEFWLDLVAEGERQARSRKQAFRHFSELGGYPRCHATQADRGLLAEQIVDTVVTRTIETDLLQTDVPLDQRLLRETFRFVCRYAGQAVRPHLVACEMAQSLQTNVSDARVEKAIQFLADAMLIHKIPALELLLRRQRHPPKLCLCDHFVSSAFLQEAIPLDPAQLRDEHESVATVAGHLIESIIGYYLQGIPGLDVAWYPARQNEPEVDFVLTLGTQRIPIEAKYRPTVPARIDNLAVFCQQPHHGAPFGLVITREAAGQLAERTIAIPASTFLMLV